MGKRLQTCWEISGSRIREDISLQHSYSQRIPGRIQLIVKARILHRMSIRSSIQIQTSEHRPIETTLRHQMPPWTPAPSKSTSCQKATKQLTSQVFKVDTPEAIASSTIQLAILAHLWTIAPKYSKTTTVPNTAAPHLMLVMKAIQPMRTQEISDIPQITHINHLPITSWVVIHIIRRIEMITIIGTMLHQEVQTSCRSSSINTNSLRIIMAYSHLGSTKVHQGSRIAKVEDPSILLIFITQSTHSL